MQDQSMMSQRFMLELGWRMVVRRTFGRHGPRFAHGHGSSLSASGAGCQFSDLSPVTRSWFDGNRIGGWRNGKSTCRLAEAGKKRLGPRQCRGRLGQLRLGLLCRPASSGEGFQGRLPVDRGRCMGAFRCRVAERVACFCCTGTRICRCGRGIGQTLHSCSVPQFAS